MKLIKKAGADCEGDWHPVSVYLKPQLQYRPQRYGVDAREGQAKKINTLGGGGLSTSKGNQWKLLFHEDLPGLTSRPEVKKVEMKKTKLQETDGEQGMVIFYLLQPTPTPYLSVEVFMEYFWPFFIVLLNCPEGFVKT